MDFIVFIMEVGVFMRIVILLSVWRTVVVGHLDLLFVELKRILTNLLLTEIIERISELFHLLLDHNEI